MKHNKYGAKIAIRALLLSFILMPLPSVSQSSNQASKGGCSYLSYGPPKEMLTRIIPYNSIPHEIADTVDIHIDFIEGIMELEEFEIPNIAYIDDSDSPNAFAYPPGAFSNKSQLLLGRSLFAKNVGVTVNGETSMAVNVSILMHEYAHVGQFLEGLNGSVKDLELMADALAGYYISAHVNWNVSEAGSKIVIYETMKSAYESGTYNYNHPHFHGTPNERLTAFRLGYNLYEKDDLTFWEAFDELANHYGL